jgi:hypothetical protein
MAGLTEFYCRLNETSHASQFKWLEYTFKDDQLLCLGRSTIVFRIIIYCV